MQTIPTGYVPTLAAAQAYLSRYPDVADEYNRASPGGWDPVSSAWGHYTSFRSQYDLLWDFPTTTVETTEDDEGDSSADAGILDGELFGIPIKGLLIAGVAVLAVYALSGDK